MLFDRQGNSFIFDVQKNLSISQRAKLIAPRFAFCAAASPCREYVYIIGGIGVNGEPITTVERYSMISDEWQSVANVLM